MRENLFSPYKHKEIMKKNRRKFSKGTELRFQVEPAPGRLTLPTGYRSTRLDEFGLDRYLSSRVIVEIAPHQ